MFKPETIEEKGVKAWGSWFVGKKETRRSKTKEREKSFGRSLETKKSRRRSQKSPPAFGQKGV